MLKIQAFLYLLAILAVLLCACGSGEVQIVEVTSTPEPTPVVVVATPTPNLEATVSAMVAAQLPAVTAVPQATATPDPTNTPRPTYTPRPTATPAPTTTPDIAATIVADIQATLAPTPATSYLSISDMVQSIEGGLVQVLTPTGSGSGFVVSDDGLIVTNAHVVEQHSSVTVRFVDGASYTGQVLGKDETIDLAVVEVDPVLLLQPMTMGDSGSARPGDEVIALGFPLGDDLGQDYTVTTGVVSSQRTYGSVDYIQTSAQIYPGNSGGPLLNRDGQVIGVNTWVRNDYESIGFAVSVSTVIQNLDLLASSVSVLADASGEWWTYENDYCQYTLTVHPNWTFVEEDVCDAYFARYDGGDLVGTVSILASGLETGETMREFAEWWRNNLVELAGDWETFEFLSVESRNDDHDGYVISYLWQEDEEYCVSNDTDLIVESSNSYNALVFKASICSFMPQSVFDEIGAMEFRY